MSSDHADKGKTPRTIGLKYVPKHGDDAFQLGTTPETVRDEIDRLFNVLASGEYEARVATKRMSRVAAPELVQTVLEASGKFRTESDESDELLHEARVDQPADSDPATTDQMLKTLVQATRQALEAGAESPEATALKQILSLTSEKLGQAPEDGSLDDLYRSFLRESVSLLETRKGTKNDP